MQYVPLISKSLKKTHERYGFLLFPEQPTNIFQMHAHVSGQVQSLQTQMPKLGAPEEVSAFQSLPSNLDLLNCPFSNVC